MLSKSANAMAAPSYRYASSLCSGTFACLAINARIVGSLLVNSALTCSATACRLSRITSTLPSPVQDYAILPISGVYTRFSPTMSVITTLTKMAKLLKYKGCVSLYGAQL
jgi:hypothetical protein